MGVQMANYVQPLKTEVMLVSNTFIVYSLKLVIDNTILQIVYAQRHLGFILTSNNNGVNILTLLLSLHLNSYLIEISFLERHIQ